MRVNIISESHMFVCGSVYFFPVRSFTIKLATRNLIGGGVGVGVRGGVLYVHISVSCLWMGLCSLCGHAWIKLQCAELCSLVDDLCGILTACSVSYQYLAFVSGSLHSVWRLLK